jgi:O-methyltransferase
MRLLRGINNIMLVIGLLLTVMGKYKMTYLNKFDLVRLIIRFVANRAGKASGVSRLQKLQLAVRIIYSYLRGYSATLPLTVLEQHLLLVEEVLRVPKSLRGDVVECGCYNGATTVSLSWVCTIINRKLIIYDSFEGLPKSDDGEQYEINNNSPSYYIWEEGEFSSNHGLDGVKENVKRFGNIEVCQFVKGYFKDTLKESNVNSIVLVFEDADLKSSVEDCLRYLWPKLQEGCKFYSHEPWSINIVSLFYDRKWWQGNLNTHPPGFYGSGYGVRHYRGIGFAKKFDRSKVKDQGKKRIHRGSKGFEG